MTSRLLRFSISPLLLVLASCVLLHEKEPGGSSKTFVAIGGKGAYDKNKGVAYDNEKSFATAARTATAVVGAIAYAEVEQAKEATSQAATQASTRQAINANNNATKLEVVKGRQELKAMEHAAAAAP